METIPVVLDDGCSRTDKFPSLLALSANQTPDWTINSVSTAFNELSLAVLVVVVALGSKRTPVAATSWLIAPTKPHTVLATHPNPHTPTHGGKVKGSQAAEAGWPTGTTVVAS